MTRIAYEIRKRFPEPQGHFGRYLMNWDWWQGFAWQMRLALISSGWNTCLQEPA